MKTGFHAKTLLTGLLGLMLTASCIYVGSCGPMAQYERQETLSAALAPGLSFAAETRDGSITVEGAETTQCDVLATIRARARSEEKARELAEQIEVRLRSHTDGVEVVIERPALIRNAHYSVSLAARVPTQTSLTLVTSDGSVRVANVVGQVDAKTSDGSIKAENVNGDLTLKTSDGSIRCASIEAVELDGHTSDGNIELMDATTTSCTARTSDGGITFTNVTADRLQARTSDGSIRCHNLSASQMTCHTTDGSINIECAADAPKAPTADVTTSDGSITFAAPPGLSAVVDASTNDGSIHTHLPITIEGKVGKSLHGTVGGGEGKIYLKTHDGSITIR